MSYFQLKISNIKNIQAIIINQIYHIIHFVFIYIEEIYDIENNMKNNTE